MLIVAGIKIQSLGGRIMSLENFRQRHPSNFRDVEENQCFIFDRHGLHLRFICDHPPARRSSTNCRRGLAGLGFAGGSKSVQEEITSRPMESASESISARVNNCHSKSSLPPSG